MTHNDNIDTIIKEIRNYGGLSRKREIPRLLDIFSSLSGGINLYPNDDAAVIRDGDGYLLLATDGINPDLADEAPFFSGWSSVVVGSNDIYAMGGRPLCMTNVIESRSSSDMDEMAMGIKKACELLNLSLVGGHHHPSSKRNSLSVFTVGMASRILSGANVSSGQDLILVVDIRGKIGHPSILSWDSHSSKESARLLEDLEVLPKLAEGGWSGACKDVSNAGILGTMAILLESSGVGGEIYLDDVRFPEEFELKEWLKVFPSFGFILTADEADSEGVCLAFKKRGIDANIIGKVSGDKSVRLHFGGETGVLFDWEVDGIVR